MPFGVDAALYGRHGNQLDTGLDQPIDIGFTGASNYKYPMREAVLSSVGARERECSVATLLATSGTTFQNVPH